MVARLNVQFLSKASEELLGDENTCTHVLNAPLEHLGQQDLCVAYLTCRVYIHLEKLAQIGLNFCGDDQLVVCEGEAQAMVVLLVADIHLHLVHPQLRKPMKNIQSYLHHSADVACQKLSG